MALIAPSVTIQEVADLAQVSPKTVSRVINNEPRVRSRHAQPHSRGDRASSITVRTSMRGGLASNRSFLIGLFLRSARRLFERVPVRCGGAMPGIQHALDGGTVGPGQSPNIDKEIDTLIGQLRLEGVILLPPLSDHPVVLNKLQEAAIPIVRIAPRLNLSTTPSIGIDDYTAARPVTAHLLNLGHRRIGFILGRPEHGATEQRYLGFIDEMRAHQVKVIDYDFVQTGNFQFSDGLVCAERMLSDGSRRQAPSSRATTTWRLRWFRWREKSVLSLPGQLSVAGFDDAPSPPCFGRNSPPCASRFPRWRASPRI